MNPERYRLSGWRLGVCCVACCYALAAGAQDRMPPIASDALTPEQRSAVEELRRTRGIELRGPWIPLLRSPEVLNRARAMGDYLRYDSTLPPELSEFLILLTASEWRQQYEWRAHHAIALEAGVSPAIAAAIAEARRPQEMSAEQAALYELFTELHHHHSVSDPTYETARALLGEQGIVDAISIVGYYTLLAMVMNTARTALPEGETPMLPPLP
jgi:4-carboxymuconolactone decarboxylase